MSALRLVGRLVALFIMLIFVTATPELILAYDAQQAAVEGDFLDELFDFWGDVDEFPPSVCLEGEVFGQGFHVFLLRLIYIPPPPRPNMIRAWINILNWTCSARKSELIRK